ncbi:hypothetical protein ACKI1J_14910 [Streptomyces scabiei]|uniref:hypothetical protein n=1 Tax=Streptomyces scabiei TaxID=1930 RepID=UPI0038F80553
MTAQSDAVRRFTAAWKRGDDNAINEITTEIMHGGNEADMVAMSRAMDARTYGGGQ